MRDALRIALGDLGKLLRNIEQATLIALEELAKEYHQLKAEEEATR